ncbi:MFS transporter [Streptomyces gilvosporeus]|uniref:MFS transporter n=1 Tax=Streptomyces gilvosporeus TaxID=553510 RepID=A0A1V0TTH2_9ACTN|nr:MFS transporter [Streptomyces gilvosporeus]ARF56265.1 MFS transporter [Streptomyces gilvosporeus]
MPHASTTVARLAPVPPALPRSPLLSWLAVTAVTLGIFSIVTTEILPIGLLTAIGADFRVSDGTAGLMMTLPGILAAVAAPAVTVATARIDRRSMLCALTLLLALADVLAAAAPAYWLVLASRVLVGVTIGGYWSIAAGLADRLVRPGAVPRATAVIFSAVPLGSVLGVPAGTFLGDRAGWRAAFLAMAVLTTAVLVMLMLLLPALPAVRITRLGVLRAMVRGVHTRFTLLLTFLIVLAHFGAYTYVTPFLQHVTHAGPGLITGFLLAYGAAGILGNFLGGAALARHPHATFAAAACALATATVLLPVLGHGTTGALALLLLWGIAYGAVPVCSQTWFTRSAPHAPEAASVLFTASFQATIALGALAGGVVVDRTSPSAVMTLGGTAAALAAAAVWLHFARRPQWPAGS